jgi:outer membrane protein assembly factor BamB
MYLSELTLSLACFALCATGTAADWPQFRGPYSNGVANEPNAPSSWSAQENIYWQRDIPGEGWSSPVLSNGRLFLTTAITTGPKNSTSDYRWEVWCLDAKSGEVMWTRTALEGKPKLETHRDNTYASETPVTDGKHVVAYFGMMGVYCYNVEGALIWKKDLGTSSSPTILEDKVFIQVDNEQASFIVALDIRTGNEIWRQSRNERSNWGSVVVWRNSHRTELITGGAIVRSYDPNTGDLLWQVDIGNGGLNATPTASGDLLVVGRSGRGGTSFFAIKSGTEEQLALARRGDSKPLVVWSTQEFGPNRASPLMIDGMIFLLDGRGGKATIVDSTTGQIVTQGRIPKAGEFWASPWSNQGKVYCLDASGQTFVLQPGDTLNVVSKNDLPTDESVRYWSTPALADGILFIRSSNSLFAIGNK